MKSRHNHNQRWREVGWAVLFGLVMLGILSLWIYWPQWSSTKPTYTPPDAVKRSGGPITSGLQIGKSKPSPTLTPTPTATIYRWVEAGKLHFAK